MGERPEKDDLSSRLIVLTALAEEMLEPFICRQPGGVGGSQPGVHCAACCMGTGIEASCQEEFDLAVALKELIKASKRVMAPPASGVSWDEPF